MSDQVTDLIERLVSLRASLFNAGKITREERQSINDAMDEIEGLRAALESIAKNTCCDRCQEAALVAQAALAAR